jgi:hypothetical protein
MRKLWGIFLSLLAFADAADAQITKTATFENYAANTDLGTSFTDPLSRITFSDPTSPYLFFIGYGLPEFGGGNDLSGGDGTAEGYLGFVGTLPFAADQLSVDIAWSGTLPGSSGITLVGFSGLNATGTVITQQSISNATDPHTLQIESSQYNIASFKVEVDAVPAAYDNISYTYLPEPSILAGFLGVLVFRRRLRLIPPPHSVAHQPTL